MNDELEKLDKSINETLDIEENDPEMYKSLIEQSATIDADLRDGKLHDWDDVVDDEK